MLTQLPAHSSLTSTYPPPQTNYLGPYTLTRLLEKKLAASKARVVTVASITHRTVRIKDAEVGGWGGGVLAGGWVASKARMRGHCGVHQVTICMVQGLGIRDQECGDGWIDGWLDGWGGGWLDGWVDGLPWCPS